VPGAPKPKVKIEKSKEELAELRKQQKKKRVNQTTNNVKEEEER
jgi:hypothetical protein